MRSGIDLYRKSNQVSRFSLHSIDFSSPINLRNLALKQMISFNLFQILLYNIIKFVGIVFKYYLGLMKINMNLSVQ